MSGMIADHRRNLGRVHEPLGMGRRGYVLASCAAHGGSTAKTLHPHARTIPPARQTNIDIFAYIPPKQTRGKIFICSVLEPDARQDLSLGYFSQPLPRIMLSRFPQPFLRCVCHASQKKLLEITYQHVIKKILKHEFYLPELILLLCTSQF